MMKEWATVVAWKEGIATLHTEAKTSCNSCSRVKAAAAMRLISWGRKMPT